MAAMMSYSKDGNATIGPARKKLKTSDLPLASATRAAIEGLAHTFKKKGGYDSLRKQVWDDLEGSDFEAEFTGSLLKVAEDELEKNPSGLLKLDRGKATLLIEGAVDRAGVYQAAEARIDHLIDAHIEEIEKGIRTLRQEDIGAEAAAAEQARGGKTDEQYAEEAAQKRAAREKIREEIREKERAVVEERKKLERARRKEEEKKIEAEQERRKEEREARKKAEREREEERERQRDRERDIRDRDRDRDSQRDRRDRSRDRDRDRDHERDRERDRDRDKDRDHRHSRHDDDSRRRSTKDISESASKTELSKEEVDRLEQEALNDLLNEGKRVARRSRHQIELEIDESLAPPPRKLKPASAILPISRDSPSLSADVKKPTSSSSKPKAEEAEFKAPLSIVKPEHDGKPDVRERRSSYRSRSRDRISTRRSSRSRSRRRRDSRDRRPSTSKTDGIDKTETRDIDDRKVRESVRSRRDSRDRERRRDSRDRDGRHRRDSRDRDDRQRRSSRDRDDRRHRSRSHSHSHDRRRSYRSRSRDRRDGERVHEVSPTTNRPLTTTELRKLADTKRREEEAKAYLAAQNEARTKGLPIPGGWNDRAGQTASTPRPRTDDRVASPISVRKRDVSRDRDRDRDHGRTSRLRSRSRTPTRRTSRIERSTSPVNIDRYVPGGGSHRHKSAIAKSPSRKRDRSRDLDRHKDRDSRHSRDDEKPRRRSRSRSRRRDRSRDRERKARSRSRSPRRERESRRDRSRSREREKDRRRDRTRSRDRDRKRSRSRGSRGDSRRV